MLSRYSDAPGTHVNPRAARLLSAAGYEPECGPSCPVCDAAFEYDAGGPGIDDAFVPTCEHEAEIEWCACGRVTAPTLGRECPKCGPRPATVREVARIYAAVARRCVALRALTLKEAC